MPILNGYDSRSTIPSFRLALASVFPLLAAPALAAGSPYAYIMNYDPGSVSVINLSNNTVVATIPTGDFQYDLVVNNAATKVFVSYINSNDPFNVSGHIATINAATNSIFGTPVDTDFSINGLATNPAGTRLYVTIPYYSGVSPNSVAIFDTATMSIVTTLPVGTNPVGIATNPHGDRVYVANNQSNSVTVINATNNSVVTTIAVGVKPRDLKVNSAGTRLYVTNGGSNTVSVINTATNTVVGSSIAAGTDPAGIALSPKGDRAYVTNYGQGKVTTLNLISSTVVTTTTVGVSPFGIAVDPSNTHVYVENHGSNSVSVIATSNSAIVGSPIAVGGMPGSYGQFIPNDVIFKYGFEVF